MEPGCSGAASRPMPELIANGWEHHAMEIVGGVYLELCEHPKWRAVFGSGGRSAAAVAHVSPGSVLHTYAGTHDPLVWEGFSKLGIGLHLTPSENAFAFAYFHPLSVPLIVPTPSSVSRSPPIRVHGRTVLRFGMVEGEAIVKADAAIYDPQGETELFTANGSTASRLALVLNEPEAERMGGIFRAMADNGALVTVLKRGARGAKVISEGTETNIPAYRSSRVFKIGSGDVFSAIFAHCWGESGLPAVQAADSASRAVANYCETQVLPVTPQNLGSMQPAPLGKPAKILIEASATTLGRRYVIEEACSHLRDLGFKAVAPCIGEKRPGEQPLAVLCICDGLSVEGLRLCLGPGIVVLAEDVTGLIRATVGNSAMVTDDFATALYQAAWLAMEVGPVFT